ncbi:MAG TPA: oxygenase MpaB family protein [Actinomycetota bacterium]|nr:oxygenase MpaB family protein [Actinomycetota bacterium]
MELPLMARVNRERVLLVGGQRALVMQLAHPAVAAGVAQHSDFPSRALERLRRTLDLSLAVIYGSPDEAEAATASIRAVHERVGGMVGDRPYRADDPDLLLWVNATLVDTTLVVYERFVRPLSEVDRRAYYDESVVAAELFGIPRRVIPNDLGGFHAYLQGMLEGPELRATDDSRRLVHDVLRPPLPLPLRPPTAVVRHITLSLLPARIRELFGLRSGIRARAAATAASLLSRTALPLVPSVIREFSAARESARSRAPRQ